MLALLVQARLPWSLPLWARSTYNYMIHQNIIAASFIANLPQQIHFQMKLRQGKVGINGSLALVSQQVFFFSQPLFETQLLISQIHSHFQAWIFNATLRENILLGSPMREAWYNQVVEACALTSDLKVSCSADQKLTSDSRSYLSR